VILFYGDAQSKGPQAVVGRSEVLVVAPYHLDEVSALQRRHHLVVHVYLEVEGLLFVFGPPWHSQVVDVERAGVDDYSVILVVEASCDEVEIERVVVVGLGGVDEAAVAVETALPRTDETDADVVAQFADLPALDLPPLLQQRPYRFGRVECVNVVL